MISDQDSSPVRPVHAEGGLTRGARLRLTAALVALAAGTAAIVIAVLLVRTALS